MVNAQDDATVAMIADIEGTATIAKDGNTQPAEILLEFVTGSEITLQADTTLTLFFFASSEEYVFDGPAGIIIGKQKPEQKSGKAASARNLNMTKLVDIASQDEDRIDLGVLKLRNFEVPNLVLTSPKDTKVISLRPEFTWSSVEGVKNYKFILANELGKTIADLTVNGPGIKLPEEFELSPGEEYTWEIIAKISADTEYRAHAYFNVAEQDILVQVEESRPDSTASFSEKVVYARLLERLNLEHAAMTIWQEIASLRPESESLQKRIEESKTQ